MCVCFFFAVTFVSPETKISLKKLNENIWRKENDVEHACVPNVRVYLQKMAGTLAAEQFWGDVLEPACRMFLLSASLQPIPLFALYPPLSCHLTG